MLFQRDSVTVIQKIFRSFSFNLSSPEQTSFTTERELNLYVKYRIFVIEFRYFRGIRYIVIR